MKKKKVPKNFEMFSKVTAGVVTKVSPKAKNCERCRINIFEEGQIFRSHSITSSIEYRKERVTKNGVQVLGNDGEPKFRDVILKRTVLNRDLISEEKRKPSVFNIPCPTNDEYCYMCHLIMKNELAPLEILNPFFAKKYKIEVEDPEVALDFDDEDAVVDFDYSKETEE